MRNGILSSWFAATLISILTGCGRPVSTSDLPGQYVADFGFATDTLDIRPDGKYTQTIKIKATGKVATVTGAWKFDAEEQKIRFSELMVVIDGFDQMVTNFDAPTNRGPQIAPVRQRFGKLEIGGDDLPWGRVGCEIPYTKQAKP